jgi:hypothetical protein
MNAQTATTRMARHTAITAEGGWSPKLIVRFHSAPSLSKYYASLHRLQVEQIAPAISNTREQIQRSPTGSASEGAQPQHRAQPVDKNVETSQCVPSPKLGSVVSSLSLSPEADDMANPESSAEQIEGRRIVSRLRGSLPSAVEIVTDESWLDDIIAKVMKSHKDGLISGRVLQVLPVEESHDIRNGFMDI